MNSSFYWLVNMILLTFSISSSSLSLISLESFFICNILYLMIIPIRCFTCGKVKLVHKRRWSDICTMTSSNCLKKWTKTKIYLLLGILYSIFSKALDTLQLKRYCCRRMILTHVDLIEKLLNYNIHANQNPNQSSFPTWFLYFISY